MTERLHDLLTREADGLNVPAPPATDVVRRARGLRRRRRLVTGAAALATAAVVGGVALVATGGEPEAAPGPAGTTGDEPVFAIGNTVYYDGGSATATVDDKAVKSLYYTSAGTLVRQGNNAWSDGGGPQRFSLIPPDGTVKPVSIETEGAVHATDPDQPYVVYGERVDGVVTLVVHDVALDKQVARVPIPDAEASGFPVALVGDTAYLQDGFLGTVYAVEWRTGDINVTDTVGRALAIHGDHAYAFEENAIVDVATGEELVDAGSDAGPQFSPDGRYVLVGATIHDLDDGSEAAFGTSADGSAYQWGWTTDGEVFSVDAKAGELTACSAETGACTTETIDLTVPKPEECTPKKDGNAVVACSEPVDGVDVILGGTVRES